MSGTVSRKRRFRHPSELWAPLLLILGGPLNPMAWWLNTPDIGQSFFRADILVFHLIPCTIMVITAVWILQSFQRFSLTLIGLTVCAGLVVAVLTAPLIVAISMWLLDGQGGIASIFFSFGLITVVGWLLGVIPYIAISKGVPCALVVVALCVIFSTRDAKAPQSAD